MQEVTLEQVRARRTGGNSAPTVTLDQVKARRSVSLEQVRARRQQADPMQLRPEDAALMLHPNAEAEAILASLGQRVPQGAAKVADSVRFADDITAARATYPALADKSDDEVLAAIAPVMREPQMKRGIGDGFREGWEREAPPGLGGETHPAMVEPTAGLGAGVGRVAGAMAGSLLDPRELGVNALSWMAGGPVGRVAGKAVTRVAGPVLGRLAAGASEAAAGGSVVGGLDSASRNAEGFIEAPIATTARVGADALLAGGMAAPIGAPFGPKQRIRLKVPSQAVPDVKGTNTVQNPSKPAASAQTALEPSGQAATAAVSQVQPKPAEPTGGIVEAVQKAEAEPVGQRSVGRPDLANPGTSEPARRVIDAIDELRGQPEPRARSVKRAEAEAALQKDAAAEEKLILDAAYAGKDVDDERLVHSGKILSDRAATEAASAVASGAADADAAVAKAMRIVNAYRMTGTEAARKLGSRVDETLTPAERVAQHVRRTVFEPSPRTQGQIDKVVSKIKEAEKAGDDTGPLKKRLDAMLAKDVAKSKRVLTDLREQGVDLAKMTDEELALPQNAAKVVNTWSANHATTFEKYLELRRNMLLSMPSTDVVNTASNIVFGGLEGAKATVASILTGNIVTDAPAALRSIRPALERGARNFVRAWRDEVPVLEADIASAAGDTSKLHYHGKFLDQRGVAIRGTAGRVVRGFGTRKMLAEDEFFKGLEATIDVHVRAARDARDKGLKGKAARDHAAAIVADYSHPLWGKAAETAERLTLQEQLGGVGKAVLQFRRSVPASELFIPFVTVVGNVAKRGASNTPLNTLKTGWRLLRGKYAAGGSAEGKLGRDIADTATGWLIFLSLGGMVDGPEPFITGASPTTPGEREHAYQTAPPMSIKIGGKYHDYSRMGPVAMAIATTVDMRKAIADMADGKEKSQAVVDAVMSIKRQVNDFSFMESIADLVELASADDPTGARTAKYLSDFGRSLVVPNIVGGTARAADPYVRDSRVSGETPAELATEAVEKSARLAVPMEGTAPPPRVDSWGRPIEKGGNFLSRMLVPKSYKIDRGDPTHKINLLIANWNEKNPNDTYYPSVPTRVLQSGDDKLVLSDDEYHEYASTAGRSAAKKILERIESGDISVDNPDRRAIDIVKMFVESERDVVRDKIKVRKQRGE